MRVQLLAVVTLLAIVPSLARGGQQDPVKVEAEVDRLLLQLKEQQDQRLSGQDEWAQTMKALIELGPAAVPTLSQRLIDTPVEQRRMLRSLPFILRGIGDPRAVPALIQTLPKCNGSDGSDMGYNSQNAELLAFMRKHDDDLEDRDPTGYNWGRPINEVRTALNKLTGMEHGEIELCHVHGKRGTPRQQYLKERLYIRCAERWADWWHANWQQFTDDENFAKVKLPDFRGDEGFELNRDAALAIGGRKSNMLCASIHGKANGRMFYDLDTGRWGGVHERWRGKVTRENEPIISKWAISEGYDLMGNEVQVGDKKIYVLTLLSGEAWEIPFEQWDQFQPTTANGLASLGRPVEETLTIEQDGKPDLLGTGAFLIITQHGTPALLRLGVQVHDTNMQVGVPVGNRDTELNPVGFRQGRRFAIRLLQEPPQQQPDR